VTRNLPGITAGEEWVHKFTGGYNTHSNFFLYPDLSGLSQYRSALNAGWTVSVSDRSVTNPPVRNTKSNDAILSTGLNISFSQ